MPLAPPVAAPPAVPPPGSTVALVPGRRPPPPGERDESCTAAWVLVAVLLAFKVVTITLVIVVATPHSDLLPMIVAMNWVWLIPLGLLISAIPFGYWYRLVRARTKRRQLLRAEWELA